MDILRYDEGEEEESLLNDVTESEIDIADSEKDEEDTDETSNNAAAARNEDPVIKSEPQDPDDISVTPQVELKPPKLETAPIASPEPPHDPNKRRRIRNSRYNPQEYDLKRTNRYKNRKVEAEPEELKIEPKVELTELPSDQN